MEHYDIYELLDILELEGFDVNYSPSMYGPRLCNILTTFLDDMPTYNDGLEDGTSDGYENGYEAGYENGYESGCDAGYESGYENGYEEARMEAKYGRDD